MNITFLIGNGFDLSRGYKTSYRDFYDWYLKCQPNSSQNIIAKLKEDIGHDLNNGEKNWADFEIGLGRFTEKFSETDVEDFMTAYEDVVYNLNSYLSDKNKENKNNDISEDQWAEIRKNLCNFYQETTDENKDNFSKVKKAAQRIGEQMIFQIISFNYTTILDEFAKKISEKPLEVWKINSSERKHILNPDIFHVHGIIDNFPIVGVNDIEQISNKKFHNNDLFKKSLIKSEAIATIETHRYKKTEEIINGSNVICLWGLSLGASDKYWWQFITHWLKKDSSRHVFIFWHDTEPPKNILVSEYYKKTNFVKRRFLRYSNLSEDELNLLQERVHIIFNTQKVFIV